MNLFPIVLGYGIAGVSFLFLLARLLFGRHDRPGGRQLTVATFMSMLWAGTLAFAAVSERVGGFSIFLVEIGRGAAWLVFLSALMSGALSSERIWLVRYGGVVLAASILLLGVWMALSGGSLGIGPELLEMGGLAIALYGLIGIEQIYRNARLSQRNGLKFLGLGLGGMFSFDLLLFSDAVVSGGISPVLWGARGYVVALCVPLILVAVQRMPSSTRGLFFSRQIVFYSATMIGAGIYLVTVSGVGYLIRIYGKDWGAVAQLVFLSASVLGLLIILMSEQTRANARVFFIKHFFENKYEYRAEWLRLINTLTTTEGSMPLKKRAIQSLAQIIGADSGYLWLTCDEGVRYRCVASWNLPPKSGVLEADNTLVRFLATAGWVLNMRDVADDPDRYDSLDVQKIPVEIVDGGFVIPLFHGAELLGLVELSRPSTPFEMNFEDHDLLKTAGQQIASYLAQELSTEQLTESRQFEAFNRLTTYIMHDLKNVMAQQSLVVKNAERHKRNPQFIDDAIETIKGSVGRMRRVLGHLQQGGVAQRLQNLDMGKLLLEVVSQCDDRRPQPRARLEPKRIQVFADRDRLFMALFHAVRNAQDATAADGTISVQLEEKETVAEITITDTGCGMDETFVRERLFKPFDSTKGSQGMGIGAYQLRETVRNLGGHLTVESAPAEGTILSIRLPLAGIETGGKN